MRHRGVAGRIRPWDPETGLDDWRRWALLAASLVASTRSGPHSPQTWLALPAWTEYADGYPGVSAGVVAILLFVMQAVRGRLGVDSAVSIGSVLLLTDNAFAIGDSVLFPRPSRVLLIIANAVFGSSAIALLALQGGVTDTNLGLLESLGDSQLGFSLVVTVLLLQLLTAIFGPPRRMTAKSATETDPNGQPAAIEPATMPDILTDHTALG